MKIFMPILIGIGLRYVIKNPSDIIKTTIELIAWSF